jgi:hypothetical protein
LRIAAAVPKVLENDIVVHRLVRLALSRLIHALVCGWEGTVPVPDGDDIGVFFRKR